MDLFSLSHQILKLIYHCTSIFTTKKIIYNHKLSFSFGIKNIYGKLNFSFRKTNIYRNLNFLFSKKKYLSQKKDILLEKK